MKAYLVDFKLITRVVAENEAEAVEKAVNKLLTNRELLEEKIQEDTPDVYEDLECPYNPTTDNN